MKRLAVLVSVLGLLAAGCGGEEEEEAAPPAEGGAAQVIEVVGTDFALDPSAITLDAPGTYTFRLVNEGNTQHALELNGPGIEQESQTVGPGGTAELTVEITESGAYELFCPVGGHKDLGMVGSVTLGEAAGGGGATTEPQEEESGGYKY